jgi:hypothetical protein
VYTGKTAQAFVIDGVKHTPSHPFRMTPLVEAAFSIVLTVRVMGRSK